MRRRPVDRRINVFGLLACVLIGLLVSKASSAQTITLYQNDFENPNVPTVLACGYALDIRTINTLYGNQGGEFSQINTVETVLINESAAFGTPQEYSDPQAIGGNYAIGMLASFQNDRLSLNFDGQGLPFINVGMDISSIDVYGCGGPFGVAAPSYRISLLDSPGGVFNWNNTVLDEVVITGEEAPDQWTFNWTNHVVALDASGSTDGNISIVWDLIQSGYGAFDNLIITSSDEAGDLTYSVGGTISGLTGSVTLQNNDGDDLMLVSDGSFAFSTELLNGATYSVSVLTQPTGQTCEVNNGTGTISGQDVSDVVVSCESDPLPVYNVSAAVSGGNGAVSCEPSSVTTGGSSTCTAVPDTGYQVSGWTGACAAAGTSTTCTLDNIQADQSSTVSFAAIIYNVVATVAAGNGSVTCNPNSVPAGGSSTCTAVPGSGFQVSGWTGACAAAGSSTTCTLDNILAEQAVTVAFEMLTEVPDEEVTPVPTLSRWGLALLSLLIIGFVMLHHRW